MRTRFQAPPGEPFRFSKRHDLSLFFQAMLRPIPLGWTQPDWGESSFVAKVPWREHKSAETYRWVSPERNVMFCGPVIL